MATFDREVVEVERKGDRFEIYFELESRELDEELDG